MLLAFTFEVVSKSQKSVTTDHGGVESKCIHVPRTTNTKVEIGTDEYAYGIPHPYATLAPKINTTSAEQLGRSYTATAADL